MNFDIAFLSNMYPKETAHLYEACGFGQGGTNITFIQTALIEGLDKINGRHCHVINKALVRDKLGRVPMVEWKHSEEQDKNDVAFSYLNRPGFSSNLLFHFSRKYLRRWIETIEGQGVLIAYGATNHNYQALAYAKKRRPEIKTGLIVPDLPENTKRYGKSWLLDIKHKITNQLTQHCFNKNRKYIDVFFPFSVHMCPLLQCEYNFCLLEGIATDAFAGIEGERLYDKDKKVVLYGGGLNKSYGLDILLDAFEQISDPDFRLVLCGNGDYVPAIKERMKRDERILFLETIPREKLLAYQLSADVLVNPRNNEQIFSSFSFPSKNMEYLSSGVPFVGFKLGGIPEEYDPYITYPEQENAAALARTLVWACGEGRALALSKAGKAKAFVLEEKNKFMQAKRMLRAVQGSEE